VAVSKPGVSEEVMCECVIGDEPLHFDLTVFHSSRNHIGIAHDFKGET
jgi:hypothetical protein